MQNGNENPGKSTVIERPTGSQPPPGAMPPPPVYPQPYYGPPPRGYYPYPAPVYRPRSAARSIFLVISILIAFVMCMVAIAMLVSLLVFGTGFWGPTGELRTETQAIPVGTAQAATVNVDMGIGNLKLAGGANDLLNASFTYNFAGWRPEVNYSSNANTGVLSVRQPNNRGFNFNSMRYDWDLHLKNDLPTNLHVSLGVATGDLRLAGLNLTGLEVNSGVGDTTIDLSGVHSQQLLATIKGGVGKTTLRLPSDIGVIVTTHTGLGQIRASGLTINGNTYTNQAYGKTSSTINVDLQVGVGDIVLEQTS